MATTSLEARRSIILLGASNLTLGWRPLLKVVQELVPSSLDLRVALGMGRSYVDWSSFWFRRLPGIVDCGLWKSLPVTESPAPLVLLTDIGNDIVYERTPEEILRAIRQCVDRLKSWRPEAQFVMTGLPMQSVSSIGPVHFRIARTILFPMCRLTLHQIVSRSERLSALCREFAAGEGMAVIEPQRAWYGVDPIHVTPPFREEAFRTFFAAWHSSRNESVHPAASPPIATSASLITAKLPTSEVRTIFGIRRHQPQPAFQDTSLQISAF